MQIIIPMSGFGERFRKAGFSVPKPLITIDDKPIIAYVIELFSRDDEFIFVCNQDHLDNPSYDMLGVIRKYCPDGRVVGIGPHKLGPIHAVMQVQELIDLNQPVVINYCDFTCYWDWEHFQNFVRESKCEGAIPAYRGFHPHTLGVTNYAYVREDSGWAKDIQEKMPYTDNRMEEYASSGTYYFFTGKLMLEAFDFVIDNDLNVGGEYYVSMAYKSLFKKNKSVAIYPLQHFMQWGTPEDLAEYLNWSKIFRKISLVNDANSTNQIGKSVPHGSVVLPMAGMGKRFAIEGYQVTKPLIELSGRPMVEQAMRLLPQGKSQSFVLRSDMLGCDDISNKLGKNYPNSHVCRIPNVTEGQACTAKLGLDELKSKGCLYEPITFGACDYGAIYDLEKFNRLMTSPEVDILVWGVRGYPNATRFPEMFGWIDADSSSNIRHISVKKPLSNPIFDPIVLGSFTFRTSKIFEVAYQSMIDRNGRVNGEFYIDTLINDAIHLGYKCRLFEVDYLMSWGTPNDLRTFEYWQSCFHKWSSHPYRLENDFLMPEDKISRLAEKYEKLTPQLPAVYRDS